MAELRTCWCADPDLEQLHRLMGMGYSQRDASLALWDPDTPIGNRAAVALAGIRTRQAVRRAFARAFPWLRLPEPIP